MLTDKMRFAEMPGLFPVVIKRKKNLNRLSPKPTRGVIYCVAAMLALITVSCDQSSTTPNAEHEILASTTLPTPKDGIESVTPTQEHPGNVVFEPEMDTSTITFAVDEYSLTLFSDLAKAFNSSHPDIKVIVRDLNEIKGDWLHQFTPTPTMLNELASNVDTFALPVSGLLVGLDSGAFLDLSPLADLDPDFSTDDFFPAFLDHFERQGGLWGLPSSPSGFLLFYRKSMFSQAGVKQPHLGWTPNDFLESAIQLTIDEADAKRYGFLDAWASQGMITFIQQFGGDILNRGAVSPTPTLDTPMVADAVRWYMSLTLQHGVSPQRSELRTTLPFMLTTNHRVAMWIDNMNNWLGQPGVGIAPLPESGAAAYPIYPNGYFVSVGTSHPQACWQWLLFLTQQQIVGEFSKELPVRRSVLFTSDLYTNLDDSDRETLIYALEHPAPPITEYEILAQGALIDSLAPVWEGSSTIEEALGNAQALAEERITEAINEELAQSDVPPVRPVPAPTTDASVTELTFAVDDSLVGLPFASLADQFHQGYPNINISVQRNALADFSSTAGSTDCFLWTSSARPELWKQHVVPLQPFLDSVQSAPIDDFFPQSFSDFGDRGDLWGLPILLIPDLIYYNKDLFDVAGVPYPTPNWDWEDFTASAEALSGGDADERQYGYAPTVRAVTEIMAYVIQDGGMLLDDADQPLIPSFTTRSAIEALDWYANWAQQGQVMPLWPSDDLLEAQFERNTLIQSGRVAMWIGTPGIDTLSNDLNIGAAPVPGQANQATDFDTVGAYISAYSASPTECWNWIMFLSDNLSTDAYLVARRTRAEETRSVTSAEWDASFKSSDHDNIQLNRWRDRTSWIGWVYPWFSQAVYSVISGHQTASHALEETQSKAEAFLLCLGTPEAILSVEQASTCAIQVDPTYQIPFTESGMRQ